jgi:hypothetical protein
VQQLKQQQKGVAARSSVLLWALRDGHQEQLYKLPWFTQRLFVGVLPHAGHVMPAASSSAETFTTRRLLASAPSFVLDGAMLDGVTAFDVFRVANGAVLRTCSNGAPCGNAIRSTVRSSRGPQAQILARALKRIAGLGPSLTQSTVWDWLFACVAAQQQPATCCQSAAFPTACKGVSTPPATCPPPRGGRVNGCSWCI